MSDLPVQCATTRIALIVSGLGAGGAERVVSTMALHWSSDARYAVTVVTLSPPWADFFEVPASVTRISLAGDHPRRLGLAKRLSHNLRTLIRLRRTLRQLRADVIISFVDIMNVKVLVASLGLGFPVIVSERTDPRQHRLPWRWALLRTISYRWAAMVILQTDDAAAWAHSRFPRCNVAVIPNPVVPPSVSSRADEAEGRVLVPRPSIVGVGRLVWVKGFDLLIRAFASATVRLQRSAADEWHLVIVGEGPQRAGLEALAERLGIGARVHLPGTTRAAAAMLGAADVFVLASRYEGFPNVLLEAMASGVPSVSTACPSGPTDIINDGIDGILVPPDDAEALAAAMTRLMADEGERRRLGAAARGVLHRYSAYAVMARWDRVIERVQIESSRRTHRQSREQEQMTWPSSRNHHSRPPTSGLPSGRTGPGSSKD